MLLDEIKRMREELEKTEKEESVNEEIENAGQAEDVTEEDAQEEIETKEEPKEEVKDKKEEKPELDNDGYAKLRQEAAAEKRRAEAAERELADLRKVKESIQEDDTQERVPLSPELQAVIEDRRVNNAEREFMMFEAQARKSNEDFKSVMDEFGIAMYQSIRVQNPRKSEMELNEMTRRAILMQASDYARKGYENPVEEMFHVAKELGYNGKSLQKQEAISKEEKKLEPDMRKVAENRRRSTGMTANNGHSEGMMTIAAALDLPVGEFYKLPRAEKQRLLQQVR